MREIDPDARIFALDTYAEMPETDKEIDAHGTSDFADAALKLKNVFPAQGLFNETLPMPEPAPRFGLAHVDGHPRIGEIRAGCGLAAAD